MHDNHYDVITKMPGFFARVYYCHTCKKAYDHREEHLCPNECKCCGFSPICPEESWRSCKDCLRQFTSQRCYDQHKRPKGNAQSVGVLEAADVPPKREKHQEPNAEPKRESHLHLRPDVNRPSKREHLLETYSVKYEFRARQIGGVCQN